MLEQLWDWARLLWNAGTDTAKNAEQLKVVQDEVAQLTELVQILAVKNAQLEREMEHLRALHRKDLEIELRLRLELSEKLRQLPPSPSE